MIWATRCNCIKEETKVCIVISVCITLILSICSYLVDWLFCDVRYQALLFSQSASILFLVVITYDRLLCIVYHLRYHTIMTFKHFSIVSLAVWSFAAFLWVHFTIVLEEF